MGRLFEPVAGTGRQRVGLRPGGGLPERLHVVGGDDRGQLVVSEGLEVVRGREVPRSAIGLRERGVGNLPDHRLGERVHAALRRPRVGVELEELLPRELPEPRLERLARLAGDRREPVRREALAQHRCVLQQAAVLHRQRVQPSRDQGVQGGRDVQLGDLAEQLVPVGPRLENAPVREHPHGLDRVHRHALGAGDDALDARGREAAHQPGDELDHRDVRERLEVQGAEASRAGAPVRSPLGELRAGPASRSGSAGSWTTRASTR